MLVARRSSASASREIQPPASSRSRMPVIVLGESPSLSAISEALQRPLRSFQRASASVVERPASAAIGPTSSRLFALCCR